MTAKGISSDQPPEPTLKRRRKTGVCRSYRRCAANPRWSARFVTISRHLYGGRALRCLAQWKSLGVRIALDDFGAGYSNLAYLSKLPIDRLKIDGALIRGISTGSRDTTIVRTVISLAVELGITVLAECVETEEQRQQKLAGSWVSDGGRARRATGAPCGSL